MLKVGWADRAKPSRRLRVGDKPPAVVYSLAYKRTEHTWIMKTIALELLGER